MSMMNKGEINRKLAEIINYKYFGWNDPENLIRKRFEGLGGLKKYRGDYYAHKKDLVHHEKIVMWSWNPVECWNDLMRVVKMIEKDGKYSVTIHKRGCMIASTLLNPNSYIVSEIGETKEEAVIKACLRYLNEVKNA